MSSSSSRPTTQALENELTRSLGELGQAAFERAQQVLDSVSLGWRLDAQVVLEGEPNHVGSLATRAPRPLYAAPSSAIASSRMPRLKILPEAMRGRGASTKRK